jgi:hypothetical protein
MRHTREITTAAIISTLLAAWMSARADSFSGRLLLFPQWTHSKTIGASTVSETFSSFIDWTHTSGTASNQMNTIICETATLAGGASRTVSLAGGFNDSFGDATTFAAVRFLCLQAASANYSDIMLGGAAANAWTNICTEANDFIKVRPGGSVMLLAPAAGYGVNGGGVCVTNVGVSNATYTIYIGGVE